MTQQEWDWTIFLIVFGIAVFGIILPWSLKTWNDSVSRDLNELKKKHLKGK